jgi:hypothetical protein
VLVDKVCGSGTLYVSSAEVRVNGRGGIGDGREWESDVGVGRNAVVTENNGPVVHYLKRAGAEAERRRTGTRGSGKDGRDSMVEKGCPVAVRLPCA